MSKEKPKRHYELAVIGFKGTDPDGVCRNQKYKERHTYTIKNKLPIVCCSNGFHLCEKPLEVLGFYGPLVYDTYSTKTLELNRFFSVEGYGEIHHGDEWDSKVAVERLKICKEIGLLGLAQAHLKLNLPNQYGINTDEMKSTPFRHTVANTRIALLENDQCISIDPENVRDAERSFRHAANMKSYINTAGDSSVVILRSSDSLAEVYGNRSTVFLYHGSAGAIIYGDDCIVYCKSSSHVVIRGKHCLIFCEYSGVRIDAIAGTTIIWKKTLLSGFERWALKREVIQKDGLWRIPCGKDTVLQLEDNNGK